MESEWLPPSPRLGWGAWLCLQTSAPGLHLPGEDWPGNSGVHLLFWFPLVCGGDGPTESSTSLLPSCLSLVGWLRDGARKAVSSSSAPTHSLCDLEQVPSLARFTQQCCGFKPLVLFTLRKLWGSIRMGPRSAVWNAKFMCNCWQLWLKSTEEGENLSVPQPSAPTRFFFFLYSLRKLRLARVMALNFPTPIPTYTGIFKHTHPSIKGWGVPLLQVLPGWSWFHPHPYLQDLVPLAISNLFLYEKGFLSVHAHAQYISSYKIINKNPPCKEKHLHTKMPTTHSLSSLSHALHERFV